MKDKEFKPSIVDIKKEISNLLKAEGGRKADKKLKNHFKRIEKKLKIKYIELVKTCGDCVYSSDYCIPEENIHYNRENSDGDPIEYYCYHEDRREYVNPNEFHICKYRTEWGQ